MRLCILLPSAGQKDCCKQMISPCPEDVVHRQYVHHHLDPNYNAQWSTSESSENFVDLLLQCIKTQC